jgi:hypothetical protein
MHVTPLKQLSVPIIIYRQNRFNVADNTLRVKFEKVI